MNAIPGWFQHLLMVVDIDKMKIRNVVRKACTENRKINLLKDLMIRKRFEEKVIKLVDIGAPNLWGLFMDGVLETSD